MKRPGLRLGGAIDLVRSEGWPIVSLNFLCYTSELAFFSGTHWLFLLHLFRSTMDGRLQLAIRLYINPVLKYPTF